MKTIEVKLSPEEAFGNHLESAIKNKTQINDQQAHIRVLRRSIDARKGKVIVNIRAEVSDQPIIDHPTHFKAEYQDVKNADPVLIVGAGPAGLFAALRLIELGLKPVVLERGKDVQSRRRDLAALNKEHIVNPESNYCFGEGGAGTYSDGKLYTRSKKRGDIMRILEILVSQGAREDILYDAHPHIGTNKLPKIVTALREQIEHYGGEVRFDSKVTRLQIDKGEMTGVTLQTGEKLKGVGVILATGHSARDIFQLLEENGVKIEAKPFALGVRVEHPQQLIDQIQYNCPTDRGPYLPASSYALVHQVKYEQEQRGVFSFCMCPGGFVVPAATAPGEVVVNGMSPSRRDSKFANSGIVVAVEEKDMAAYSQFGALAGLQMQADIEKIACKIAGGTQTAPAQRLVDFAKGRVSSSLNDCSYQPGLASVNMDEVLPDFIAERLKVAFKAFGRKMKGYYTNDAQIIGVESRTSSPVRVPRNKETLEHVIVKRLYPCGEGAGYAGGIVSAAMDGERCAEALVAQYAKRK